MRSMNQRSRKGFTLIELLLVMVILVVLAGVVVTRFGNRTEQARDAAAKTDISAIDTALEAFQVDCQRYPTNEEGLGALITPPAGVQDKWKGPYLKRNALPTDPWNNQYVYRYPGTHNAAGYDLYSMGADGREGGDDIDNWSVQR